METPPPVKYRTAEPEERAVVGGRIDAATADVWFVYGYTLDPYGDLGPYEEDNVGREWFAADPGERVAVHFCDLPEATRDALEAKRLEADRQGWDQIYRVFGRESGAIR